MKIKTLDILGFGKWENKKVEFNETIHLVYGENEAGKSTIYQFIREIFFGFPIKRGNIMDYTPKGSELYGGSVYIEHPVHGNVRIERLKSKNKGKALVHFPDGRIGTEEDLEQLVAPLTKELFDHVFSLQQEQLNDVKNVTESQLQNLLLTIGLSGSKKLMNQQQGYDQSAQKIYKPNGRLPILNKKIVEYQKLQQEIAVIERSEEKYHFYKKELGKLSQKQQEIDGELQAIDANEKKLQQQREFLPLNEEREGLEKLMATQKNEKLTETEEDMISKAYQEYQFLIEEEKRLNQEKNKHLEKGIENPALVFYLAHEEDCQNVMKNRSEVEKLAEKKRWIEKELNKNNHKKQKTGWTVEVKDDWKVRPVPTGEDLKVLKTLGDEEAALLMQEKASKQNYETFNEKRETCQKQLEELEQQIEEEPASKQPVFIPATALIISLVIAGVASFVEQVPTLPGIIVALIVAVIGVITGLMRTKQPDTIEHEELMKQNQLEVLEEQVAIFEEEYKGFQSQLLEIQEKKKPFAERYYFSMEEPCSKWLDGLNDRTQVNELITETDDSSSQLKEVEEQLNQYAKDLEFMNEWVPVKTMEIDTAYQESQEFINEMSGKKQHFIEIQKGYDRWLQPLKDVNKRQKELSEKILPYLENTPASQITEIPLALARQKEIRINEDKLAELSEKLKNHFDFSQPYTLEKIDQAIHKNDMQRKEVVTTRQHVIAKFQEVAYELKRMEQDGSLDEKYQQREAKISAIQELANQWITYRLGESMIQKMIEYLSEQQLPALLTTTTDYFGQLTNGNYINCWMENDKLMVTNAKEQDFTVFELSTGTRDQLYMALRLAFIQMHSQEEVCPVIIDDGWLRYDSKRKLALFNLLQNLSQAVQIICFSSDSELLHYFQEHNLQIEEM